MNTKVRILLLGILSVFLISSANAPDADEKDYQVNISQLLNTEAEEQYQYTKNEIATKKEWYKSVADQTFNKQALIVESDNDPVDVILRRTQALIDDLKKVNKGNLVSLEKQFNALKKEAGGIPVSSDLKRKELYLKIFELRRKISLTNPLLDFDDIVFTASYSSAGDFHMCDQYYGVFARPGGSILKLKNAFGENPQLEDLIKNKVVEEGRLKGRNLNDGMFLMSELSYDSKQILFAYSECARDMKKQTPYEVQTHKWSKESSFHIFSMNIDGTKLTQLTDGGWNDVSPCWMPDGRITFISERRGGFLRCSGSRPCPNYTLHAMDASGNNISRLSHHETNEWHPSVNNQGMLLYTRWDYVDRGDDQAHHPWITTPDGRNPRSVHGNFKYKHHDGPDMEVYVRPIPNSHKYVSLAAPHHGGSYGSLIIIDPKVEDDDAMAPIKRLTPEDGFPECKETLPEEYEKRTEDKTVRLNFGRPMESAKKMYAATWALSENYYLTSRNKKLYLIDAFGNRELIYEIPGMYCLGPVPFKARKKPPVIPSQSHPVLLASNPAYTEVGDEHPIDKTSNGYSEMGKMIVLDVYNSFYPFPEGTKISDLRIIQVLQKTTPVHQEPAIGYGAETPARSVLGTVPVEEDGSAYFYLPAGKSVYFQALDKNGEAIQSMRSATYVQGGESISCIGCHEQKHQTPNLAKGRGLAMRREPSTIKPGPDGSNPFSYPRLVQPVLDNHCIKCHDGRKNKDHSFDLRAGNWKKDKYNWYTSYKNLHKYAWHHGSYKSGYDLWLSPRSIPGEIGAKASKLLPLLKNGHADVKLSDEELQRLVIWLDANSDFYGSYENIKEQAMGEIVQPTME